MNDDDDLVSAGCADSRDMILEAQDTLGSTPSLVKITVRCSCIVEQYSTAKTTV
jgi:hypothetical protein